MSDLPENKDLWTQEQWHKVTEQLVQERLKKDPTYKDSILEKLIRKEMWNEAASSLSNVAYEERCKRWQAARVEEHATVYRCVCSRVKELFK